MNAPKCLGRIASFSISTGTGQIISEQGTTIAFNYRDWLGSRTPSAGMRIRYIAGKEGEAHQGTSNNPAFISLQPEPYKSARLSG